MKLKALLLALAVAGLAASFGLTATGRSDTGTTTGTTSTTTTTSSTTTTTTTTTSGDCRPFWLTGAFASISAASFTITPSQGRREKAKTAPAGPMTIALTPDTHVFWQGKGTLAGPSVGDIVGVYGKQCGSALTAWAVRVRFAKGSEETANHGSGELKPSSDGQPKATEGHSRPKR
jgi:hypothetical protein